MAAVVAKGSRCWKVAVRRGSTACFSSLVGDQCKFRFCTIDGPLTRYQNVSAGKSTHVQWGTAFTAFAEIDLPVTRVIDRPLKDWNSFSISWTQAFNTNPPPQYIYWYLVLFVLRRWSSRCVVSICLCLYKVPSIDSSSMEGIELDQSSLKGNINFSNIEFCYPSRQDIKVNA